MKEAHASSGVKINNKGRQTWVLEVARILSIQYACYMTLFTPTSFFLSRVNANLPRWSAEHFHRYGLPHLGISKEALIHALSMFDFLYCSRDDDRLLATIALRVCHLTDKSQWRFRRLGINESNEPEDCNYLTFSENSWKAMFDTISTKHRDIGYYRPDDIRPQLSVYESLRMRGVGFAVDRNNENEITGLTRLQFDRVVERRAIIFEVDPETANRSKHSYQFCISIQFLEDRFGFKIGDTPEQIREKLELPETLLEASMFEGRHNAKRAYENLAKLVQCTDKRAPIVKSMRRVLSTPTLERSLYEDEELMGPVPKPLFQYRTFYLPDDVHLTFPDKPAMHGLPSTPVPNVRVPLDGMNMVRRLFHTVVQV